MRIKALVLVVALMGPTASLGEPVGYAALPLSVPVRTYELQGFSNVGDLTSYLLARVGYSLVVSSPAPVEASRIAGRPINPAIYKNNVLTIEAILVAAIGRDNKLIVDVANRLVSFEPVRDPLANPVNPNARYFTGRVSELRR
jgi:hypothetical protein|tara:strand:+ start:1004 stop:1432 length:429 start_codon:yes stop_codon:yes gene_type:complete